MADPYTQAQEYWGYLIERDKTPTPLLEQLLLGLANYIVSPLTRHLITSSFLSLMLTFTLQIEKVTSWRVRSLTPAKLAEYYRLVEGNYDDLFLKSGHESLAFTYRSLGCFYTLQPGSNPFVAPTLPALTPEGFVRWQFIQILLDPDAHVPLLQEAVKRFDIRRPDGGEPFPHLLPEEALPLETDEDILKWYKDALETLRHSPPIAKPASRGSSYSPKRSYGVQSVTDSSADDSSFVDASDYFPTRRTRGQRALPRVKPPSPDVEGSPSQRELQNYTHQDQRRNSATDQQAISDEPWIGNGPTPTAPAPPCRARPTHISRSYTTRVPRTQSTYDSDGPRTGPIATRGRDQRSDRSPRSGERLTPFLDTHGRRHSASNVHDRSYRDRRYELPQSNTLSPPFYARPSPPDLPSDISLPRPQSAVRFDTPNFGAGRPRTASHPRAGSSQYSSSSGSESDQEEAPVRRTRSISRSRDERHYISRRSERR